jgi:hypothetical protein
MPQLKQILPLALCLLLAAGCTDPSSADEEDEIRIDELTQEWKHSMEEETNSIQIYRPGDYQEYPASRYRQIYRFEEDGKCEYLVLASNDGHYFDGGYWTYVKDTHILSIADSADQVIEQFDILELTSSILRFIDIPVFAEEDNVPVQVDLHTGFAGHMVLITLNGVRSFEAMLSEFVRLSGPMASFSTSVPRGETSIQVFWYDPVDGTLPSPSDTDEFTLEDAEQYYLYLNVYSDSLIMHLQDAPFLYD